MTVPSYTEEDVDLAERVIIDWALDVITMWGLAAPTMAEQLAGNWARVLAPRISDALASAGRLVPPGSETREEWRVGDPPDDYAFCGPYSIDPDPEVAPIRARQRAAERGGTVEKRRRITTPWMEEARNG